MLFTMRSGWAITIMVSMLLACDGSEMEATGETGGAPLCEDLDSAACQERSDCMLSNVTVVRQDADGTCQQLEETVECHERMSVTAGCAGGVCDESSSPAPWYEERSDSGYAIADVDQCGDGIAGWQECQGTDDGVVPAVCACACSM